jgi:hypothetical protein
VETTANRTLKFVRDSAGNYGTGCGMVAGVVWGRVDAPDAVAGRTSSRTVAGWGRFWLRKRITG